MSARSQIIELCVSRLVDLISYIRHLRSPDYCKACKGYHTTSDTKDEYYERLEDVMPYEIKRTDNDHGFIDKDHKRVRRED